MLSRNEETHYENRLERPARFTRYEFLVHAFAVLDRYGSLPIWFEVPEAAPDISKRDADIHSIFKARSDERKAWFNDRADARLLALGVQKENLDTADGLAVRDNLAWAERAAIMHHASELGAEDDRTLGYSRFPPYPKEICQDVIVGTMAQGYGNGRKALCKFLNQGKRNNENSGKKLIREEVSDVSVSKELNVSQVTRATEAFRERYLGRPYPSDVILYMSHAALLDVGFKVVVLLHLENEARKDARFCDLDGADLAIAVDRGCGLVVSFDRIKKIKKFQSRQIDNQVLLEKKYGKVFSGAIEILTDRMRKTPPAAP